MTHGAQKGRLKEAVKSKVWFRNRLARARRLNEIVHSLLRMCLPGFQFLSEKKQSEIIEKFESVDFEDGDPILTKGDMGTHFYIVNDGEVSIVVSSFTLDVMF